MGGERVAPGQTDARSAGSPGARRLHHHLGWLPCRKATNSNRDRRRARAGVANSFTVENSGAPCASTHGWLVDCVPSVGRMVSDQSGVLSLAVIELGPLVCPMSCPYSNPSFSMKDADPGGRRG